MRVLGVDPGYTTLGFGVVDEEGNSLKLVKAGVIDTSDQLNFNKKLLLIHDHLVSLLSQFVPDVVCIEEVFFGKNVKTGMKVAQVIGVVRLEAERRGIQVLEVTPLEVKRYVAGAKGKHPKIQVQNLVKLILGLDEIPKPDDCADAVAIAIAGIIKSRCC